MSQTTRRRVAMLALMAIASGWYGYMRSHLSAVSLLNGAYSNPCCADVVIQNGLMKVGAGETRFKLEQMKFGLTANPDKALAVQDHRLVLVANTSDQALLIGGNGASFSVPGNETDYVFVRRRSE